MKVAVVGYGYWGPNIVRNFVMHPNCRVQYIIETDEERRELTVDYTLNPASNLLEGQFDIQLK